MLKKILGEAPFKLEIRENFTLSPKKAKIAELIFTNNSEFDLPLSCTLHTDTISTDRAAFDVTSHAGGTTLEYLTFSLDTSSRLFGGKKICELEICDRIFDTRVVYELCVTCEMCYRCSTSKGGAFTPCDEAFFTKNGVLFGNKGEIISMEVPSLDEKKLSLHVMSGKIKNYKNHDTISLAAGLNRLAFEIEEDASVRFLDADSGDVAYFDTLGTRYFL